MAWWNLQRLNRRPRELRTPGLGLEGTRVSRRMWHHKSARPRDVHLIGLAAGHHTCDMPADPAIIVPHASPVNVMAITQRRLGKRSHDRHFGAEVRTGRS